MVDLFQFKNIYAVKLEMMRLTEDVTLQNECVLYVTLPGKRSRNMLDHIDNINRSKLT